MRFTPSSSIATAGYVALMTALFSAAPATADTGCTTLNFYSSETEIAYYFDCFALDHMYYTWDDSTPVVGVGLVSEEETVCDFYDTNMEGYCWMNTATGHRSFDEGKVFTTANCSLFSEYTPHLDD
ncbi:hypothetical protein F5Y15DRAFT_403557 [Xylariaceae sp. FL0016]|nr:hypothetical protein F5Y15DRAFT_403557 [Xylariaceae sp. FL0016]